MEQHIDSLVKEFSITPQHATNIVNLLDEGNTIPFIARYRKEMTGAIDDQVLRDIADRLDYLRNLDKRKGEVSQAIVEQGKMTPEILAALNNALTLAVVEDIYRPYKQKKKTRASIAIAKGLEPLADIIMAQEITSGKPEDIASSFVDEKNDVKDEKEALAGACDIIAERISDDAKVRAKLRAFIQADGLIATSAIEKKNDVVKVIDKKLDERRNLAVYDMYKEYSEKIASVPSHRILAINRGEKEELLKVDIVIDKDKACAIIESMYIKQKSIFDALMKATIVDSYTRLIFPSLEREIRGDLTDKANEQAIKMFDTNLRPLLLQPPLKGKVVLGFDPAYRTGCKLAVVDEYGNVLDVAVIYPTPPESKIAEAELKLKFLCEKHKVNVISIGNGTASKESEIFVAEFIKKYHLPISYIVVNEAGASVYSASKLGAEEFPDYDVSQRSAVSIARRLQDPLAELIKIDVKSIGVGQYQHDMPQKRLTDVLGGVVESCVNTVGVELNSASPSLLGYVAGLNSSIAKNIVEYRRKKPFESRQELLKVAKLGAKAYEQCAGFLRINDAKNVLDNTAVHPEAYEAVNKLLKVTGYTLDNVAKGELYDFEQKVDQKGIDKVADYCGVGIPTLKDIITELKKPGRDIRDSLPQPILRSDLMDIADLKPGMEITGTVRNVIDFGAFVDIGVHQDGLVHISQISDNYVKHPSDVLSVGDIVKVRVLEVDPVRKKISLTMKSDGKTASKPKYDNTKKRTTQKIAPRENDMASALSALMNKFNTK